MGERPKAPGKNDLNKKKTVDLINDWIKQKGLYAKYLGQNIKNFEADLKNRQKNLNLLFVNFVDGFLKDGADGEKEDDWVHISNVFYDNDFRKPINVCGDKTIKDLGSLNFFSRGDKDYDNLVGTDSNAGVIKSQRAFCLRTPVLGMDKENGEFAFRYDVFEEPADVSKSGSTTKRIELKDLASEFSALKQLQKIDSEELRIIVDNLKLASGYGEKEIFGVITDSTTGKKKEDKNAKVSKENFLIFNKEGLFDSEGLLNYIFDLAEKGEKIKYYNTAAVLGFFSLAVCSDVKKIIDKRVAEQEKINKGARDFLDLNTPAFGNYENLRYDTDIEEKKDFGTFDPRNKLIRSLITLSSISMVNLDLESRSCSVG